ncbi:MAG: fluoride efflux transporter CrcB [Alphaproteobacteria bacterium]|nr:fluoride efflux transporter CrcB [Alphaproteobacteria bacterium]
MKLVLAIAVGGAFGAVARHFVGQQVTHWLGQGFPWGTLVINVAGSLAMGVLVEAMALSWHVSPEVRALLTVGVLGAFTTFSTFALDAVALQARGEALLAFAYIAGSVVLCVGGLFTGMRVARLVLA